MSRQLMRLKDPASPNPSNRDRTLQGKSRTPVLVILVYDPKAAALTLRDNGTSDKSPIGRSRYPQKKRHVDCRYTDFKSRAGLDRNGALPLSTKAAAG